MTENEINMGHLGSPRPGTLSPSVMLITVLKLPKLLVELRNNG